MALPYEWQLRVDKIKRWWQGLSGGGEAPRPKMCPACGTLVGVNATRCHECGTSLTFSLAAAGRGVSSFFGGNAPVTTVLLIVNFLMFAVTLVSSMEQGSGFSLFAGMNGEVLFRLGAVYPPAIFLGHQWFRLVTAMFLHGSVLHIAFNMWVLWDVGVVIEDVYGSARYLFLYTVTGIAGYVLSALGGHFSVGASGAIMGLVGLMLAITTIRGGAAMRAQRSRLIMWIVIIFAQGLLPGMNVDNWAHFGGLAAGFGLGRVFADRQPALGSEMKRAYALGWLAAIILVTSFAFMILHVRDNHFLSSAKLLFPARACYFSELLRLRAMAKE
ncbi:MAG: rhomboid family intramembrane serine protease [Candidatus Acidiferrum sp.]|jgi:rhomboid protease GluP